jgi:hypothetical protein
MPTYSIGRLTDIHYGRGTPATGIGGSMGAAFDTLIDR